MRFDDALEKIMTSSVLAGHTLQPDNMIIAAAIMMAGNNIANSISTLGDDIERAANKLSASIDGN